MRLGRGELGQEPSDYWVLIVYEINLLPSVAYLCSETS